MGGDHGSSVTVPAGINALEQYPDLKILLVGLSDELEDAVSASNSSAKNRLEIVPATQIVAMDESPALALKRKKDSSMRVAINAVKDATADACVSAGNTGALMAMARFVLKTLPGIDRPAIVGQLPRIGGSAYLLDMGASVDSPPELLLQFGLMGSTLVRHLEGKDKPVVRLLNIGIEDFKGNELIKQAAELFRESGLNYKGFIEGDGIYTDSVDVDVIVCDGFVGNVALKTSEGLAQMITTFLKEEFMRSPLKKMSGLIAKPAMNAFKHRVDHRQYNGATLLGLRGTVVKSHGGADEVAFSHAVHVAYHEAIKAVPQKIHQDLMSMQEAMQNSQQSVT